MLCAVLLLFIAQAGFMSRAFRPVHAIALLLMSCVVLAQPTVVGPNETAPPPPGPPPTGGTAPPLQACAAKAFDDYASAMSAWERQWADGVISARPDFTAAVIARANAHNSALQRDAFRIHYLAANLPQELDLDESIAAMRLFDWTAEEEQALRLTQPDYAEVADSAERDRLAADAQPKADELESYFEETFTDSAGAAGARKLNDILQKGNAVLAQCHKSYPAPPAIPGGPQVETPPPAEPVPLPSDRGGGLARR
jgi:hypothetical protein